MQFISALVEHLVVGVISLLWVMPLLNWLKLIPTVALENKEVILAIGLPTAYVIGIYVDVLASYVTALIRKLIDKYFPNFRLKFFGTHLLTSGGTSYERTQLILKNSPDELARYLLQLVGREKIARGTFMNLVIATIFNLFPCKSIYSINPWILMFMSLVAIFVWLRLNALTDIFKEQAVKLP